MPFKSEDIENVGKALGQTIRRIFYWVVAAVVILVVIAVLVGVALG